VQGDLPVDPVRRRNAAGSEPKIGFPQPQSNETAPRLVVGIHLRGVGMRLRRTMG
jgi:hypothetical protein